MTATATKLPELSSTPCRTCHEEPASCVRGCGRCASCCGQRFGRAGVPPCEPCQKHYGDHGPCDEGKPVDSPHRRIVADGLLSIARSFRDAGHFGYELELRWFVSKGNVAGAVAYLDRLCAGEVQ